jgi:type VI secretion system secreted protein Hcp
MALQDYFLKIDGIDGESADAKFKANIEVESWSWDEHQTGTSSHGGGLGAGKVQMSGIQFVMRTCKASPKLLLACADGEHIKKATLVCRKAGKDQQVYLTLNFTDITISSYQTHGAIKGGTLPFDSVKLNFAKIEFEYKEQKQDGTLGGATKSGWDLLGNKKI